MVEMLLEQLSVSLLVRPLVQRMVLLMDSPNARAWRLGRSHRRFCSGCAFSRHRCGCACGRYPGGGMGGCWGVRGDVLDCRADEVAWPQLIRQDWNKPN